MTKVYPFLVHRTDTPEISDDCDEWILDVPSRPLDREREDTAHAEARLSPEQRRARFKLMSAG